MTRRVAWRLVQAAAAVAVLIFVGRAFARNWIEFHRTPLVLDVHVSGIMASALVVWAMYLVLIAAWRTLLVTWGQPLGYGTAARIWSLSSLGKYIPGKVWAIAGMAVMARERGVAAWTATASAILLQVLALGTGAVVVALTGTAVLESRYPEIRVVLAALGVASAVAVGLLLAPRVTRRVLSRFVPGQELRPPAPSAVLLGIAANVVAWVGYGIAFRILGLALLPDLELSVPLAIGAFTASYVVGFLALLVPGGLLVREGVMVLMLQGPLGLPAATALAIGSRLLLTVTELGIAVPFLFFPRETRRVAT
jgi:hypothetical protein